MQSIFIVEKVKDVENVEKVELFRLPLTIFGLFDFLRIKFISKEIFLSNPGHPDKSG